MQALETYLMNQYEELARREDEERCREVEEDEEDNVFDMGEIEFITKSKVSINSGLDESSLSSEVLNHENVDDTDHIVQQVSQSPLSLLSSNLTSLNLNKDMLELTLNTVEYSGSRIRRPSQEAKVKYILFEKFCPRFYYFPKI